MKRCKAQTALPTAPSWSPSTPPPASPGPRSAGSGWSSAAGATACGPAANWRWPPNSPSLWIHCEPHSSASPGHRRRSPPRNRRPSASGRAWSPASKPDYPARLGRARAAAAGTGDRRLERAALPAPQRRNSPAAASAVAARSLVAAPAGGRHRRLAPRHTLRPRGRLVAGARARPARGSSWSPASPRGSTPPHIRGLSPPSTAGRSPSSAADSPSTTRRDTASSACASAAAARW